VKSLLVHSFKGGSGKTIFSANLAKILAMQGKKVLLIETDFGMPAFYSIFTDIEADVFLNGYLQKRNADLKDFIYPSPSIPNLDLIFTDAEFDPSHKVFGRDQTWFQSSKVQLERSLDQLDYDYVIFDTTPGMSLFVINLLLITNVVYLLARSDTQSIRGTQTLIETIYKKTVDLGGKVKLFLVMNQIPLVPEMESLLEEIQKKFRYSYPFIEKVVSIGFEHQTSYLTAINEFLLPKNNPTYAQIFTILESTELI